VIEAVLNGILPVAFVIALGWLSAYIKLLRHEDAAVSYAMLTLQNVREAVMKLTRGCHRQREDPDPSLGFNLHLEDARLLIALGALAYRDDIADEHRSFHGAPPDKRSLSSPYSAAGLTVAERGCGC
jgi:hypothetical protein